jgi:hypothetical protein
MRKLFLFAPVLLLAACAGEEEISPVPVIEFVSVTPPTVAEYTDSVTFRIHYRDGDGDLGENTPDVRNCWVRDPRNGVEYGFRINQLGPSEAVAIEGHLNITLPNLALVNGTTAETAAFDIWVQDRAGNSSNQVTSSVVTIIP